MLPLVSMLAAVAAGKGLAADNSEISHLVVYETLTPGLAAMPPVKGNIVLVLFFKLQGGQTIPPALRLDKMTDDDARGFCSVGAKVLGENYGINPVPWNYVVSRLPKDADNSTKPADTAHADSHPIEELDVAFESEYSNAFTENKSTNTQGNLILLDSDRDVKNPNRIMLYRVRFKGGIGIVPDDTGGNGQKFCAKLNIEVQLKNQMSVQGFAGLKNPSGNMLLAVVQPDLEHRLLTAYRDFLEARGFTLQPLGSRISPP